MIQQITKGCQTEVNLVPSADNRKLRVSRASL